MRKGTSDLTEIFSVSSNDSSPEIGEILKKKKSNNEITTYDVVAHIEKNKRLKILDRTLSNSEIDFIQRQFCK